MDKKKLPLRRRFLQLFSALLYNCNFKGFASGTLYKGALKGVCVPGLNCYSCPGAVGACPLGSLQASLNGLPKKLPFYVLGSLCLFGVLFGRAVCAFLCPIGLVQDVLYKIPAPKLKKSRVTRALSLGKYVVLAVFVAAIPLYTRLKNGVVTPGFCKYICPSGTLLGSLPLAAADESIRALLGPAFWWKLGVLLAILLASVFIYRPFCRFLCPLGAIYSFFNPVALLGIRLDCDKCTDCGACVRYCKCDVRHVNDRECIRCGECRAVCKFGALSSVPALPRKRKEEKS